MNKINNKFNPFKSNANVYRYYFSRMNVIEKAIYNKLLDGFYDFADSISVQGIAFDQIQEIYQKMKQDNPTLFFLESVSYQQIGNNKTGRIIPKYRFSKKESEATLGAMQRRIFPLLKDIRHLGANEKEKQIHDYLCENVIYDDGFAMSSFECVGPILFAKGVCEGISKAVKFILDCVGVQCIVVYGEASQEWNDFANDNSHAWNMINIENEFYHLDVTFDLTIKSFNILRYDYFNLSDREISVDHKIRSLGLPICNISGSYYKTNNLFMNTQNDYKQLLKKCIKNKQQDIVFQLPRVNDDERVKNRIMKITGDVLGKSFAHYCQYHLSYNEAQYVFHIHLS